MKWLDTQETPAKLARVAAVRAANPPPAEYDADLKRRGRGEEVQRGVHISVAGGSLWSGGGAEEAGNLGPPH